MRIGFVSTMRGHGWGGSEELWARAAHRLLGEGHAVAANVKRWPAPIPQHDALAAAGATLFLPPPPWRDFALRILDRIRRRPHPGTEWLEEWRPDLVVISMGWFQEGALFMERCGRLGIPYVLVIQQASLAPWFSAKEIEWLRSGYEGARQCLFVSEHNLRIVSTQFGTTLRNARVVRNPFNVQYDERLAWPTDHGDVRLAGVARLDFHSKGQDLLVDVLRQDKWRRRPLTVSLYGDGPCSEVLGRLIEAAGLTNLKACGHVKDVAGIWRQNHALIMPSRSEGLPLALVEAMLCGRPAIVTDVGGNAEVVRDGETGFIAPAPTAALLDATLERAWERRADWRTMGERAAEDIRRLVPSDPVRDFVDILRAAS